MSKQLFAVAVFLVAIAVGASCQSTEFASPVPVGAGPIATVTVRGGECPEGPCGGTTVIEYDGRVHKTAPVTELARLPGDVLNDLHAAVRTADFDAIRARPFTGECPVAFDGQEFIYEFAAPGGTERIATCETEIDPNHPLFVAITAAMAAVHVR